jgi:type I restriction enzyme M protein
MNTTSKSRLSAIIKSARDIMRKDAGLSGELDRLPQLSWILFLKFLDDMERVREAEAAFGRGAFEPVLEAPYRWRDWAADPDYGLTGDELLAFVNGELIPHLRGLRGSESRLVVRELFGEIDNRMRSGYLLRDVVNLIDGVHFTSQDEVFTLSHLYESMLAQMRDAAGDSGEIYTPRPVVRLIVECVRPRLGETVLDPAAGTAGFMAQAYEYLGAQKRRAEDERVLQEESLHGIEKKPLPYLLGTMNLMLHGLRNPRIRHTNALIRPLKDIGPKDRYDVIMTNPPFGGEEEAGIQLNFPEATRTAETALLFLQFIMRSLKPLGRVGMVVPNGTLFADGVTARIKGQLLADFNLHTIVRLPNGVFAPYTSIPTNLLFFDRTGPTTDIWYYEHPLPDGRKNYTKTKPLAYEEFAPLLAWWDDRQENERAWRVAAADLVQRDDKGNIVAVNLDLKNPNAAADLEHMPPEELVESILAKEKEIIDLLEAIRLELEA